jgi:hypothetical protein
MKRISVALPLLQQEPEAKASEALKRRVGRLRDSANQARTAGRPMTEKLKGARRAAWLA